MVNRLYLLSSLFFVAESILAIKAAQTPANDLTLLGSLFFFFAALTGVMKKGSSALCVKSMGT
jgi:hypothetical protein